MDSIRIGLVGLGHRGLHWLRMLERIEGYRITALCDPIASLHERALAALESRDGVTAYASYEDMLGDPQVDAVAVTVRCQEQGALAAMALEAGKHVNCEVPAAHTLADCWRIVLAQERSGLVYQLGEQTRFWGYIDAWRDVVQSGKLGRVTFCEGQYIGYYGTRQFFQNPDSGEFAAVDELDEKPGAQPTWLHTMPPIHYLPHELSPLLKVLDDRVLTVTAMSTAEPSYSHPEIGQPDIQAALMKTEKGRHPAAGLRLHAAGLPRHGPPLVPHRGHERRAGMEAQRQGQAAHVAGRRPDARYGGNGLGPRPHRRAGRRPRQRSRRRRLLRPRLLPRRRARHNPPWSSTSTKPWTPPLPPSSPPTR